MTAVFRTGASVSLLILSLAVLPTSAVAEDELQTFDPYPLRAADTSSPRDTLRSFNSSVNEAVQAWLVEPQGDAVDGALILARRALVEGRAAS